MIKDFFHFIDARPWAPWAGIAMCMLAVSAIQGTNFPFIW